MFAESIVHTCTYFTYHIKITLCTSRSNWEKSKNQYIHTTEFHILDFPGKIIIIFAFHFLFLSKISSYFILFFASLRIKCWFFMDWKYGINIQLKLVLKMNGILSVSLQYYTHHFDSTIMIKKNYTLFLHFCLLLNFSNITCYL